MDSGSNDITFNTEIYFQYQPQIQLSRNDAIKLIFVKLFSVSQNAHCDIEVEKFIYNAFTKKYQNYSTKLLCDWHVKRNLFENLSKISVVEKRKEIKKDIKNQIDELDENTFDKMLTA
jgi:hypothetical protein